MRDYQCGIKGGEMPFKGLLLGGAEALGPEQLGAHDWMFGRLTNHR